MSQNPIFPPTVKPNEVTAEFRTQRKDTTSWLVIEHHETTPPTNLLAELAAVGWVNDPSLPGASPLYGVVEITLHKPGSALFKGWTADERKIAMRDARKILVKHGFPAGMKPRVLTLADMM